MGQYSCAFESVRLSWEPFAEIRATRIRLPESIGAARPGQPSARVRLMSESDREILGNKNKHQNTPVAEYKEYAVRRDPRRWHASRRTLRARAVHLAEVRAPQTRTTSTLFPRAQRTLSVAAHTIHHTVYNNLLNRDIVARHGFCAI
jgi:hypothetical protein